jgi:hypothetical protein
MADVGRNDSGREIPGQIEAFPSAQRWLKFQLFLDGASGKYTISAYSEDFWTGETYWMEVSREYPLELAPHAVPSGVAEMLRRALEELPPF